MKWFKNATTKQEISQNVINADSLINILSPFICVLKTSTE